MIQLRLRFSSDDGPNKEFEIVEGELLSKAVERSLEDVPLGARTHGEVFQATVNGLHVAPEFWEFTALKEKDVVILSPRIKDGDAGQIFKQVAIIAIAAVATYFLGPAGYGLTGAALAGASAAITIGATLLLNALIPPPIPKNSELGPQGGIESSQMYAITGQSNQMNRLGTVPKVYGAHRMFPNIAALPYTELGVAQATRSFKIIQDVKITATVAGTIGNNITITYTNTATAGHETISLNVKALTIGIQSGVTTAQAIVNIINATVGFLCTAAINGVATNTQVSTPATNLQTGTDGGTVQYLYGIYDFGLGTNMITDLKIGDTPLTTDSFNDFQYNLVDPNRPDTPADVFDKRLAKTFQYYKGHREVTALALDLSDGSVSIQNSDANPDANPQEIVLDFVAERGLYGFSSDGTLGERNIRLKIEFAPVGSSDWKSYNDMSVVDSYTAIGGTDVTDFYMPLVPTYTDEHFDQFYTYWRYSKGPNNYDPRISIPTQYGPVLTHNFNAGGRTLLVPASQDYLVGAKIFFRERLMLGLIQSVVLHTDPRYMVITLDRAIDTDFDSGLVGWASQWPIYYSTGNYSVPPATDTNGYKVDWVGPFGVESIRTSRHESGIMVVQGSSTNPVYANVRFKPKAAGQFQVRVSRISASGPFNTSVGDDLTWNGITTAYVGNPINTDKRHTFMEIRIKATDQLNGNVDTLSATVSAVIPIYNQDTGEWTRETTSNPAWIFCDLLTGEVNKKSISRDKLHMPSIIEWSEFCDEFPAKVDAFNYVDPRFTCNFVLDYQTTLQDLLAQVGGAAQASLNIIDGKYGVLIDKFKATPVQIFTPRNSKDFSSMRNYGNRPDGVKVTYIDPGRAWEVSEIVAYDNGFTVDNAVNLDSLTAFACTSPQQAWRFGRYMIAQNRLRQETISLLVDFEQLVCTRGDYVQITQDVMEAGGTPARVKEFLGNVVTVDDSIDILDGETYGYVYRSNSTGEIATSTLTPIAPNQFAVDGDVPGVGDLIVIGVVGQIVLDCLVKAISPNDDSSANVTLVEKADAVFDYEITGDLPDYNPQISLTSSLAKPPRAVLNLTVVDNFYDCAPTKSGYAYYIDIAWDVPTGAVYENFEIYVNDGRGYINYTSTTSKFLRYAVDQSRLDILHGFKVVAVSATGKKLQLIQMPEVTAIPLAKTSPPSNVDNFSSSITNQVLQLSWSSIPDCDCFRYVLRFSPDTNDVWESSTPLMTVAKDVTSASVQARTGVYMIKAIDFAGNESAQAEAIITTIPNLFDLNIIEVMNEAPGFAGTLDQIEIFGDAVILREQVPGDQDSVIYYNLGYYEFSELLDLDDIYTVRLQSLIRADGYKKGEVMADWIHLSDVEHLNTALHSDWNISLQYRATDQLLTMSDWVHLNLISHINFGSGLGFTAWRDIPTTGDATGRVFQFRVKLESLTANVTPRLFDTSVSADMPDRVDSFENEISSASIAHVVSYDPVFKGPGTSPNIQITMDNGQTGDYWVFETKTLEGFSIRFYDKNNVQVVRQFDAVAKGYGRRHTITL